MRWNNTIALAFIVMIQTTISPMSYAQEDKTANYPLPDLRERAALVDEILQQRVQKLLPSLMRRAEIDMWILVSRENNEDPTLMTLLPADWYKARRRTILVFIDQGIQDGVDKGVEALSISRYAVGDIFRSAWNPEQQPDQWQRLVEVIEQYQPQSIGVNQSDYFAQADGLVATDKEQFMAALPEVYQQRVVSAEALAIGWLETRIEQEIPHYQHAVGLAQAIIATAFSNAVITPGVTSTTDVEWWMLERVRELKLSSWFPPTVTLQRQGESNPRLQDEVIQAGDLLHVDFGITYLRLNTDTQQHAYVLRPGESTAPNSLINALQKGNQVQDFLTAEFATGRSGNEIFLSALGKAKDAGLRPSIYSHPIGYYGHGSGPTLGMWDKQRAIPVNGDYPLYPNTAYSIELNTTVYSDDWQQDMMIMLEEDAYYDGEAVEYLHGRQQQLYLIKSE